MKRTECSYKPDDICIIGMSGIFPESPDLIAYWKNLVETEIVSPEPLHLIGRIILDLLRN